MENGTQFLLKIEPETDQKEKKQHQRKHKNYNPRYHKNKTK